MPPYAEGTEVPVARSRAEVERLLTRYGASEFMSGWSNTGRSMVAFKAKNRYVRFEVPMPDPEDARFWAPASTQERNTLWGTRGGKSGHWRKPERAAQAYEAESRRRWRALALVIKAKLESVESGISTFEHEFMAHIVMPGGLTVGEMVSPRIAEAYETGKVQPLLPAKGETS